MRVVNKRKESITQYDLSKGHLRTVKIIRADAVPLGPDKLFWATEDYEEVQMYIPHREKSKEEQISALKRKLSDTDYKVIKCAECQLLGTEMPYDIAEIHSERQAIRDEINKLEMEE